MTAAFIAALVVVCVSSSFFLREAHARHARSSERFLDALIAAGDRNQVLWEKALAQLADVHAAQREEVQSLLQRIQAPEIAVIQHQQDMAGPDEVYPLNDRETAEAQQEHELALERIEKLERDGIFS